MVVSGINSCFCCWAVVGVVLVMEPDTGDYDSDTSILLLGIQSAMEFWRPLSRLKS